MPYMLAKSFLNTRSTKNILKMLLLIPISRMLRKLMVATIVTTFSFLLCYILF